MTELKYIAFMGAIKHTEKDYVIETIMEYGIGTYLISLETAQLSHKETGGEHFHFMVQMTDEDYHKFSKRVFIDKYKLRGRALKDKPRQYGRVKNIENLERMAAYTIKDGNIVTNMTQEELDHYKTISFKKTEIKEEREIVLQYIKDNLPQVENRWGIVPPPTRSEIGSLVIKYHRVNKTNKPLARNYILSIVYHYMSYCVNDDPSQGIPDSALFELICGS